MKNVVQKISFVLLIITFLSGCRAQSFLHTQDKIQRLFSNYETYLNGEKIGIDTIYLDKNNIKSTKINKMEKTIHFTQKKKDVKYFSPQDFDPQNEKYEYIVINRQLADKLNIKKIEVGALKSITILRQQGVSHSPNKRDVLIITLK